MIVSALNQNAQLNLIVIQTIIIDEIVILSTVTNLKVKRMLNKLFPFLIIYQALTQLNFDLTQTNKYGNTSILKTLCNQETQIDLFFSSNSKLACDSSGCTTTTPGASTMKFLDVSGNDLQLTLVGAYALDSSVVVVSGWSVTPMYYFTFLFETAGVANQVIVLAPIILSNTNNIPNVYDVTKMSEFADFQSPSTTANVGLDAFNYMNIVDYSRFYHVTDTQKKTTLLLSNTILQLPSDLTTPQSTLPSTITFTPDYSISGSKLCYASNETSGIFQQHLRESWPFWTCMLSVFFYWVYYLWSDAETHQVYDKKYEENKWTCWGFYSLHYLAHTEFISVLSRESLMFFNFSFQGLVLSAIYSTLGEKVSPYTHYEIIIWSAVIALVAGLPIPFILGGIFLRKISNATLEKFKIVRKSRGILNKKSQEAVYEQQLDKLEETLYSYYFFYYVIIFIGLVCFWVPDIYMMMQTHRDWYYLHRLWLASLMITFVLDNLVLDPFFSYLLGNTKFYRCRGYYYNFELGQEYKEIQE